RGGGYLRRRLPCPGAVIGRRGVGAGRVARARAGRGAAHRDFGRSTAAREDWRGLVSASFTPAPAQAGSRADRRGGGAGLTDAGRGRGLAPNLIQGRVRSVGHLQAPDLVRDDLLGPLELVE